MQPGAAAVTLLSCCDDAKRTGISQDYGISAFSGILLTLV